MKIAGPTVKKDDILKALDIAREEYNSAPIAVVDVMIAILDDFKITINKLEPEEQDIPLAGIFKVLLNTSVLGPFHSEKKK